MSFIDLDDLKTRLGIPLLVTDHDDLLTNAVNRANAAVLAFLCLDQVDPMAYELSVDLEAGEYYQLDTLRIEPRPVVSVAAVYTGSTLLDAAEYRLRDNRLKLLRRWWDRVPSTSRPSARVTATCGFDDSVPHLLQAKTLIAAGVLDYAEALYSGGGANTGLKSETIGRYKYERMAPVDMGPSHAPTSWPPSLADATAAFADMTSWPELTRETT